MRWRWLLACVALGACGIEPLRGEELYGARAETPADAAVSDGPRPDADRAPDVAAMADATTSDAPAIDVAVDAPPDLSPDGPVNPSCNEQGQNGSVSGVISDACSHAPIDDAQVGIAGKHSCAWRGKGSFDLDRLPAGCDRTLVIMRAGYRVFSLPVHIDPNGNPGIQVLLEREGGCATTPPATSACTCVDSCPPAPP
jgi:hypothetical protein